MDGGRRVLRSLKESFSARHSLVPIVPGEAPYALAAAALMVVDAVLSHPFWSLAEPDRSAQLLHFMKNACMVGGLLLLSLVAPVARRR